MSRSKVRNLVKKHMHKTSRAVVHRDRTAYRRKPKHKKVLTDE